MLDRKSGLLKMLVFAQLSKAKAWDKNLLDSMVCLTTINTLQGMTAGLILFAGRTHWIGEHKEI